MSAGTVLGPGEGRQFATPFGTVASVKVDVGDGDFAIFESGPPPGQGQPPHVHDAYDEAFYIVSGELVFQLDGHESTAKPGATVFAPRGTVHGFANTGAEPVRMLVVATPRAVELVESLGRLVSGARPDPAAIRTLFMEHQSRLIGGPA